MWYYFTLVDLESQSKGQVSEPVDICLGKVLKKSLIWWMTKEGEPCHCAEFLVLQASLLDRAANAVWLLSTNIETCNLYHWAYLLPARCLCRTVALYKFFYLCCIIGILLEFAHTAGLSTLLKFLKFCSVCKCTASWNLSISSPFVLKLLNDWHFLTTDWIFD